MSGLKSRFSLTLSLTVGRFWVFSPREPLIFNGLKMAPEVGLERLEGLVVLDEVQRKPELFALLRVLADRKPVRRAVHADHSTL